MLSCRRPRGRQEQALAGARSSRVLDRHSTRRRMQCAAGARGWLRRTEQEDGTKAQKALSSRSRSPIHVSEEASKAQVRKPDVANPPTAVGGADAPCLGVPGPTPNRGLPLLSFLGPLRNVAVNVVKPPGVRLESLDWDCALSRCGRHYHCNWPALS